MTALYSMHANGIVGQAYELLLIGSSYAYRTADGMFGSSNFPCYPNLIFGQGAPTRYG